jgi:hypothetical protein
MSGEISVMTIPWPNQITAANAGWRTQFRYRGSRHRPGVAEFYREAAFARPRAMHRTSFYERNVGSD